MIVSVADAAVWTGQSADDVSFQRVVSAVDAFVKRFVGRQFEYGTYTEYLRGYGWNDHVDDMARSITWVKEWPIASVTSLRIDYAGEFGSDTEVDDLTKVAWVDNKLILLSDYLPEGDRVGKLVYVGGYQTDGSDPAMPEDLRGLILDLIARDWKRGADELFQSERIGSYSYVRFQAELDPKIAKALARFRP